MKRLILIPIIVLLLLVNAWAIGPAFLSMVGGSNPCPPFYADTNVLFSWDGNHTSGINYGCLADGTPVLGTNNNLGISATYGEIGNGALLDTLDEYLTFTDSGDTIIDDGGLRTIFIRAKMVSQCTVNGVMFEAWYDINNYIRIEGTPTTDDVRGLYIGQSNAQSAIGTDAFATIGTWKDVGYSWTSPAGDETPTGDHSGYKGSFERDTDELGYAFSNNATEFSIGEYRTNQGPCAEAIYVDKIVIMSGFETPLPTNW